MLAGGAFEALLGATRRDACVRHTAPLYCIEREVLAFLHALQWNESGGMDLRWELNGLDWAPLFVEGTYHLAVVLYPRTDKGKTEPEWGTDATFARILRLLGSNSGRRTTRGPSGRRNWPTRRFG